MTIEWLLRKQVDVLTVMFKQYLKKRCIECDACVDICPEDCINFIQNADEKS